MKRPIFILIVSLIFSCRQAPKPETTSFDTNFEILHGRVKQLQEFYREGKENGGDTEINDFDIHGNLLQTRRAGNSNFISKYEYDYGTSTKKIAVMTTAGDEQVPLIYKYDANGRIVLEVWNARVLDPTLYSAKDNTIFKYDPAGNRIEESYSSKDYSYKILYKYDDKHLLTEETYFVRDEKKPERKTRYRYTSFDAKGNWLEQVGNVTECGLAAQLIIEPVVRRKITYY